MIKEVANFYSGKGEAGSSIFYSDGDYFYEAVFLESEGVVGFKKALDLTSSHYAGYNDWRLPKREEVEYILHNVKGAKDKSFWLNDTYVGESYRVTKTWKYSGGKCTETEYYSYMCVENGKIDRTNSEILVCLVRKFKQK